MLCSEISTENKSLMKKVVFGTPDQQYNRNFGESLLKRLFAMGHSRQKSLKVEPRLFMSPRPFVTVQINQMVL